MYTTEVNIHIASTTLYRKEYVVEILLNMFTIKYFNFIWFLILPTFIKKQNCHTTKKKKNVAPGNLNYPIILNFQVLNV